MKMTPQPETDTAAHSLTGFAPFSTIAMCAERDGPGMSSAPESRHQPTYLLESLALKFRHPGMAGCVMRV
jgi:hypothetical protein